MKGIHKKWEWWKKHMLSKDERENLTFGMYLDFLCSNGYEKLISPKQGERS